MKLTLQELNKGKLVEGRNERGVAMVELAALFVAMIVAWMTMTRLLNQVDDQGYTPVVDACMRANGMSTTTVNVDGSQTYVGDQAVTDQLEAVRQCIKDDPRSPKDKDIPCLGIQMTLPILYVYSTPAGYDENNGWSTQTVNIGTNTEITRFIHVGDCHDQTYELVNREICYYGKGGKKALSKVLLEISRDGKEVRSEIMCLKNDPPGPGKPKNPPGGGTTGGGLGGGPGGNGPGGGGPGRGGPGHGTGSGTGGGSGGCGYILPDGLTGVACGGDCPNPSDICMPTKHTSAGIECGCVPKRGTCGSIRPDGVTGASCGGSCPNPSDICKPVSQTGAGVECGCEHSDDIITSIVLGLPEVVPAVSIVTESPISGPSVTTIPAGGPVVSTNPSGGPVVALNPSGGPVVSTNPNAGPVVISGPSGGPVVVSNPEVVPVVVTQPAEGSTIQEIPTAVPVVSSQPTVTINPVPEVVNTIPGAYSPPVANVPPPESTTIAPEQEVISTNEEVVTVAVNVADPVVIEHPTVIGGLEDSVLIGEGEHGSNVSAGSNNEPTSGGLHEEPQFGSNDSVTMIGLS